MRPQNSSRRRFQRHQAEIPVEISTPEETWSKQVSSTHDISNGGLSFISETPLKIDQIIKLTIRITRPYFEETAKVIWCHANSSGHEIGVQFLNNQAVYGIRMVEQVCHIEQYRKEMKDEFGRELSTQEAALEWISKYAADYREHD
jgi:hypothetical protein